MSAEPQFPPLALEAEDMKKSPEEPVEEVLEDPWAVMEPPKRGKDWGEKTCNERLQTVGVILLKVVLLLGLLYLFICSLDFLSNAFRLLGGRAVGDAFTRSEILANPVANMMLGVLATVLLQSSSTTTSIIVSMVASEILQIWPAIFMVMGANIGTSVTNTIVSLGHAANRNEFRRAFAGATVHDMFNWLAVLCLLPVEWVSGSIGSWKGCGLLCQFTKVIVHGLEPQTNEYADRDLLKVITKPFTSLIIQLDKNVIKRMAQNKSVENMTLVKHWCKVEKEVPVPFFNEDSQTCDFNWELQKVKERCVFMFENISNDWSDAAVGVCLLVIALATLCICLVCIVKLLHSLLQGRIAKVLKKFVNADFPGWARHFTGYLAIILGAALTMLVQSSSIFTSAVTPLVGVGVLHLDRMYPLTLGANIGTTFTAILAALASDADRLYITLQVALCHLFFNILGIMIWYPIPRMRAVPIKLAKALGNTTARYRWFAMVYLLLMFFVFPGIIFALSIAGGLVLLGVAVPVIALLAAIGVINVLQTRRPDRLPARLRSWSWLPAPLRSLQPYDDVLSKIGLGCRRCCPCCERQAGEDEESQVSDPPSYDNTAYSEPKAAEAGVTPPVTSPDTSPVTSLDTSPVTSLDNAAFEDDHETTKI